MWVKKGTHFIVLCLFISHISQSECLLGYLCTYLVYIKCLFIRVIY